jgi:hypothetical protein
MQPTNRDFRDLFFEFGERSVRYLVVGAYAVTHYSKPRFTKDLDIWIDPDPRNARKAWEALGAYGAPIKEITPADLAKPGNVLQIGVTTTRIDILTSVEGLVFEDCWPRRTTGEYMDMPVNYVSRADLIRNKKKVGRPQDLLDVRTLEGGAKRKSPKPLRRTPRRRS